LLQQQNYKGLGHLAVFLDREEEAVEMFAKARCWKELADIVIY